MAEYNLGLVALERRRHEDAAQHFADSLRLKFHARQGAFVPWWKLIEVVIYDWPSLHAQAKFSSSTYPLKTSYDEKQHALHLMLSDVAGEAGLTVRGRTGH
jgi:hypothetical protein